jgi:hypothetical protein
MLMGSFLLVSCKLLFPLPLCAAPCIRNHVDLLMVASPTGGMQQRTGLMDMHVAQPASGESARSARSVAGFASGPPNMMQQPGSIDQPAASAFVPFAGMLPFAA